MIASPDFGLQNKWRVLTWKELEYSKEGKYFPMVKYEILQFWTKVYFLIVTSNKTINLFWV